jgi:hypothetical protein
MSVEQIHDEVFRQSIAAGCRPEWLKGMLGFGWHCSCKNGEHQIDQQCSVSKFYKRCYRV